MIAYSLWNLAAWSGQVMVIVAVATLILRLVRMPQPKIRLVYWQGVVAVSLALPWLPRPVGSLAAGEATVTTSEVLSAVAALDFAMTRDAGVSVSLVVAAALGLGLLIRGAWLLLGMLRLRALRHEGRPAELDADVEALRRRLAPCAQLRFNDTVGQPATFGWSRPVILLPPAVAALDPQARRAVVCHELLHAARGDWAWRVVEEVVCCVFWFHPAIRWAVDQVQLSREEAVDEQVVDTTAVRQPYMRALVEFASTPGKTLAVPFVGRYHLASRIARLTEGRTMTGRRLTISGLVPAAVLAMSVWAVAYALPLRREQPAVTPLGASASVALRTTTQRPDEPLRVGGDIRPPEKIYHVNPIYPEDAQAAGVEGVVIMEIVVDREGGVGDVQVVRSIPELDLAATDAVWQWRYVPTLLNGEPVAVAMMVTVRFTLAQ